jgi:hypothetical protein
LICRNALPAKIGNGETWPDGSDCSGIVRGRPAQAPKNRAAPPHNHRRWHMLNQRIGIFTALPLRSLNKLVLQNRVREIGQMEGSTAKVTT